MFWWIPIYLQKKTKNSVVAQCFKEAAAQGTRPLLAAWLVCKYTFTYTNSIFIHFIPAGRVECLMSVTFVIG